MHVRLILPITLLASTFALAADVPRLAPEDFPILPWGGTPGDRAVLEEIRACGFNLAGFVAPDDVPAVAEAGLKCIVSDRSLHISEATSELSAEEVEQRVRAIAERFRDNPAVLGYYLRDEPSAVMFDVLGRFTRSLRQHAPRQLAYVNLFPIYATPQQLGTPDYATYIETFVDKVAPPFISYDNYSLFDDGSVRDAFYENLEIVRAAALRHELPFWNIVLGNAHFHYAEPSDATLNFQTYATLAYGGRGLSFFTYFAPRIGNYRLAPIDQFGHKTPTWDMLRRVLLQVHRIGPTYLQLQSVNVVHHPTVPPRGRPLAESRHLAALAGGNFLVGKFVGPEDQPYVMVVNKDLKRSAVIDVKFKEPGQVEMVNPYTGQIVPLRGEDHWLAPGAGRLLRLRR